jgi:hypothetical protein
MCDQFHCRSVVEFPPPIILPFPPVLSTQRPVYYLPPDGTHPRLGPGERPPGYSPGPQPHAYATPPQELPPQRRSRSNVEVPPPDADEAKGIETDIEAFCDGHPDETFCSRLGKWLRNHPRGRP